MWYLIKAPIFTSIFKQFAVEMRANITLSFYDLAHLRRDHIRTVM